MLTCLDHRAPPVSIDQIVSDFDGVTFHISTPEAKSKILISISLKCFRELVQYGAQSVLEREYGPFIVSPEPGYDFSIVVDLENLPAEPAGREDLVNRIALMRRNVMAAPFEKAFDEFAELQEEAARYTSESAPQGVAEGGEVMAIHYREQEAIYIKASHDRVTVIFSTIFRDETDRIFGKVFLQVCFTSPAIYPIEENICCLRTLRNSLTQEDGRSKMLHKYFSVMIPRLNFKAFRGLRLPETAMSVTLLSVLLLLLASPLPPVH